MDKDVKYILYTMEWIKWFLGIGAGTALTILIGMSGFLYKRIEKTFKDYKDETNEILKEDKKEIKEMFNEYKKEIKEMVNNIISELTKDIKKINETISDTIMSINVIEEVTNEHEKIITKLITISDDMKRICDERHKK